MRSANSENKENFNSFDKLTTDSFPHLPGFSRHIQLKHLNSNVDKKIIFSSGRLPLLQGRRGIESHKSSRLPNRRSRSQLSWYPSRSSKQSGSQAGSLAAIQQAASS